MKKEAILLLDDEDNIRRDLGEYLQEMGHVVHKASSAEEARKLILSEYIDFAIIDLKIDYEAEFGGIHVVDYVKRIQPKAKTIVLSAYTWDEEIKSKFEISPDGYVSKGGVDNYIIALLRKLKELESKPETKNCFVIMPFSNSASCSADEWTEIFDNLIKPAVENAGLNYVCKRSNVLIGSVIEHILDELNRADVVIADLTDKNPNVFYELGVRHALREATILIAQDKRDIPFDLQHQAFHVYDWKLEKKRTEFKERIKEILSLIEIEPNKTSSPVRRYLDLISP